MRPAPAIRAIGRTAHAALLRSGGRFERFPGGGDAAYARAAGEIIWIGRDAAALHPRAVVLDRCARGVAGDRLDVAALVPWQPPARAPGGAPPGPTLRRRATALRRELPRCGTPAGFAAMLVGATPPFPLARAAAHVRSLARACRAGDANAFQAAALPLLGLGPGLTPSGDDLVGALLFARRALAGPTDDALRSSGVVARLCAASEARSHPIGAALFRDLAAGESFAPLHRLVAALADPGARDAPRAGDAEAILAAARELVAIGHSSGWDMLAGLLIGVTRRVGPAPRARAHSERPTPRDHCDFERCHDLCPTP